MKSSDIDGKIKEEQEALIQADKQSCIWVMNKSSCKHTGETNLGMLYPIHNTEDEPSHKRDGSQ